MKQVYIPAFSGGSGVRPKPQNQLQLPPWSIFLNPDPGGIVHTIPPPEYNPPTTYDKRWWRGDIGGVMIYPAPPIIPDVSNTTPPEMTMSFVLPWYKQFGIKQIDAILTGHAIRNYSHFLIDRVNCEAAGLSVSDTFQLIQYLQSWGFIVPMWMTGSPDGSNRASLSGYQNLVDSYMNLITKNSKVMDSFICLPGEELNNGIAPGSPGLDDILNYETARCNLFGIDNYLHFTSNYRAYPPNGISQQQWAQQWIGKITGQMWQGDQNNVTANPPTLGNIQAQFYDCRSFWQNIDPAFIVVAGEYAASAQLDGNCSEELGCLFGLGLLYATAIPPVRAVDGFCNGGRYPNGSWI